MERGRENRANATEHCEQRASRTSAVLQWHKAASKLWAVSPLGEYLANISGGRLAGEFHIETLSGALRVQGNGAWNSAAGMKFEGTADAADGRRIELAEMLDQVGTDQGGGMRRLSFSRMR